MISSVSYDNSGDDAGVSSGSTTATSATSSINPPTSSTSTSTSASISTSTSNTSIPSSIHTQPNPYSPMAQYDLPFTPMLPSQLLFGSPFQPGTPSIGQFGTFSTASTVSPAAAAIAAAAANNINSNPNSSSAAAAAAANYLQQQYYSSQMELENHSRTVYLGNVPVDTTAEQILNHVRSGVVENIKLIPEKNCIFVSFLDHSSAAHFHADAVLKKLSINGQDIKIGWGRSSPVPSAVSLAVAHDGASRNVYLGNLPDNITEEDIYNDVSKFGLIDTIKLVREKNIGFVHFLSIATAIKVVAQLPLQPDWTNRKVYYGKDRCAYISKTQQQNAAQYLGIASGFEHILANVDRELLSSALAHQSAAAVAVATTAGGANNIGNRTIYLGNVHPETTIEEICNVVRGGLLHNIRYIPERHICFVTFIDPTAAAQFFAMANLQGLSIHNRRLKVGWGKHSGPLMSAISLAVTAGASRNVYIGNIDDNWPESKLRKDFSEFGDIEQINFLPEKSCAFVNFTDITNAIKAIEGIKEKEEYKQFKINFGKDRCGNSPRVLNQNNGINGDSNGSSSFNRELGENSPSTNSESTDINNFSSTSILTSSSGSQALAQYLSQAQHEQYMYAAAMAAAVDQARYQQHQLHHQLYSSGRDYYFSNNASYNDVSDEEEREEVQEDDEISNDEDNVKDKKDSDEDEASNTTLGELSPLPEEKSKNSDNISNGKSIENLKIDSSTVYGLAIES